MIMSWGGGGGPASGCVQRGFNGNVLGGCPTSGCVLRGFNCNVLGGCPHHVVSRGSSMVMLCPEGVQNKCSGGIWCRGFMSWGDTLTCVISRGVQLFYGIAQIWRRPRQGPASVDRRYFTPKIEATLCIEFNFSCVNKPHADAIVYTRPRYAFILCHPAWPVKWPSAMCRRSRTATMVAHRCSRVKPVRSWPGYIQYM